MIDLVCLKRADQQKSSWGHGGDVGYPKGEGLCHISAGMVQLLLCPCCLAMARSPCLFDAREARLPKPPQNLPALGLGVLLWYLHHPHWKPRDQKENGAGGL